MKAVKNTLLGLTLAMALTASVAAQSNPCNPCGGKAMKAGHAMGNHGGRVFLIDDAVGRNSVTFKSNAPLEDIVGTSNKLTGMLVFDPSHPETGGHGEISVPVASLNTGIPVRDEHLAGADWLNAEKNPNISFKITEIKDLKSVKSTAGAKTFDLTAVGDFSLNGKTKRLSAPVRITYLKESEATKMRQPGDLLAARASFEVALADFGITGPAGMDLIGSKIGKTIEIELSLVAASAAGAMAGNPCGGKAAGAMAGNPCGQKASKK